MSIGYLDFDVALEAVRDASRNNTIDYIETKHIVAHAQAVLHRRDRARAKITAREEWDGDPKPLNWDAYCEAGTVMDKANRSGDIDAMAHAKKAFDAQTAIYHEQLRAAGIDPNHSRHPYM